MVYEWNVEFYFCVIKEIGFDLMPLVTMPESSIFVMYIGRSDWLENLMEYMLQNTVWNVANYKQGIYGSLK